MEKRKVASNEEKTESWERYKRRKLAECEETGRRVEKMVKGRQRKPTIYRNEKEKDKGELTGKGRVESWLEMYGIETQLPTKWEEVPPLPRGVEKQVEMTKRKEKVYVERGEYKFTFYKSVEVPPKSLPISPTLAPQ